jgi:hypothetical protein
MYLFTDNSEMDAEKIQEVQLTCMAKNMKQFVKVYRRDITIKDERAAQQLDMLEYIAGKLLTKQYQDLIKDPTIIVPENPQLLWTYLCDENVPF